MLVAQVHGKYILEGYMEIPLTEEFMEKLNAALQTNLVSDNFQSISVDDLASYIAHLTPPHVGEFGCWKPHGENGPMVVQMYGDVAYKMLERSVKDSSFNVVDKEIIFEEGVKITNAEPEDLTSSS